MLRLTGLLPLAVILCVAILAISVQAQERNAPLAEEYLTSGRLAEGEEALEAHLKANPDDDEARFGLAAVQMVRAIERLAQSLYEHGPRDRADFLPFIRVVVPHNPDPKPISYERLREILAVFQRDVLACEATLAAMHDTDVKLPLHFGRIRLDTNADGKATDDETLWRIYAQLNRRASIDKRAAEEFVITFDKADVHWLRGYCHLLAATCDTVLAYDFRELFERTGHVVFEKVESPYEFLARGRRVWDVGGADVLDLIAMIHLINFPLAEEERMPRALEHLQAAIEQSRLNWRAIEAEMDDDHEWVPGPRQTGVIPGVRVTQEMVDAWRNFLTEAESILAGERLIPFWRADDPHQGVNLHKVFTEPRQFDLVLWVQGSAVEPYLEEGETTRPAVWAQMGRTFGGQFVGFAFWFN